MKYSIKRFVIVGAAVTVMAMPALAYAEDDSTNVSSDTTSSTSEPQSERVQQFKDQLNARLQQMKDSRQEKAADLKANLQEKLDSVKEKACENHVNTINRLMTNMNKRRQNVFDRISKITTAVENFYTNKNLSVSNYDSLVASVDAAKSVAQTAMAAQQAIPSLDCSGDHPRADVADFKEKRQESIDAMQSYRDAVKSLVKAVKTAAESTKSSTEDSTHAE